MLATEPVNLRDIKISSPPVELVKVHVSSELSLTTVRQQALLFCNRLGLTKNNAHYVATSASELATNIVVHGNCDGYVTFSEVAETETFKFSQLNARGRGNFLTCVGVEIEAVDFGPGIEDVELALRDGYSTVKGSLGFGLPGVKRLMDFINIETTDAGTKIVARKFQCQPVN